MDKFFKFLNSDRYQYTESEIYLKNGMENKTGTFDVFLRLEKKGDYGVVYGIDEVLELIDILNSTSYKERKKYLSKILNDDRLVEYISAMVFSGSIRGVRNGEIVYSNEPVLTVTAPLIQGKILETPILNILSYQTLAATVSSKIVQAAGSRKAVFMGVRRGQGFEASMSVVKAAYITGCSSSSLMGEYYYSLESMGTMTHSYIQSFGMGRKAEYKAFDVYIKTFRKKGKPLIMLVDTYDTLKSGILNAIEAFKNNSINDTYEGSYGIRIDSGNLYELSKECRKILKKNGFHEAKIILTGGLTEEKIRKMVKNGVEADVFGVGDFISVPEKILTAVYKMSRIDEEDVMKISNGKEKMSYPGNKNLYRMYEEEGITDIVTIQGEDREKELEGLSYVEKLTRDFIVDGKRKEENCKLLSLEETKKYYERNMSYFRNECSDGAGKRNRVVFSDKILELTDGLKKMAE